MEKVLAEDRVLSMVKDVELTFWADEQEREGYFQHQQLLMDEYSAQHTFELLLERERENTDKERERAEKAEWEKEKAEWENEKAKWEKEKAEQEKEKAEQEKEKAEQEKHEMAINLLNLGVDIDIIVKASRLSEEEIRGISQ
ncbi:MAG: hypothetical protein LBR71_05005 [Synergistaceae bacterium]|jgi:uncharacterized protein (DUF3084 family)|nr:hypothetical protein [Synergistaceae bacterium]